jgi:signal transduction histidine kinase
VELMQDAFARATFETPEDARESRELLAAVTREVDRLTEVTEQYLRMARPPRPSLGPTDVTEVLASVLEFSREELERAGVEVVRELTPDTPPALADDGQLRQVFLNLLRNAREAMPDGGQLIISTQAHEREVEVALQDTGRGMTEAVRSRIFEPFFSTKEDGTGLGLAVCQQILKSHGGSLSCRSEAGRGTTFSVKLPRA